MRVLSLCDYSGVMLRPWAEAGHECVAVDIEQDHARIENGVVYLKHDVFVYQDATNDWDIVFAFPPCTALAGCGARYWPPPHKGIRPYIESLLLVERCLEICNTAQVWMLENPVGRLSQSIGPSTFTFDPYEYGGYLDPPGDFYTKRTCIWASDTFRVPPKLPTAPTEGSKMHLLPPSDERPRLRSVTPAGFARAVYEANRTPWPVDEKEPTR